MDTPLPRTSPTRATCGLGKRCYELKRQSRIYSGQARYADMSSIATKVFKTLFIHIQWSQSRLNRQARHHGQVVHNTNSGIRLMQTRSLRLHSSGCTTHLFHRQVREFSSNSFVTEILLSLNRSCSRYVKVLYSDNILRRSRRLRHMGTTHNVLIQSGSCIH